MFGTWKKLIRRPSAAKVSPHALPPNTDCRLCGGKTHERFRRTVLFKYDVGYQQCDACGSVQTDPPFWLDEAYAIPGVHIDVGIATRTVQSWIATTAFLEFIGFPKEAPALDFGSASGLFPRLMRDAGYNFYAQDKYSAPFFVNYFIENDLKKLSPKLITAFEVFEHFPEPAKSISEILESDPDIVMFSTGLVDEQPDDWRYFVPECGQHVFFYSSRGLESFAARHGYEVRWIWQLMVMTKRGRLSSETEGKIDSYGGVLKQQTEETGDRLLRTVSYESPQIQADFATANRIFTDTLRAAAGAKLRDSSQ